MRYAQFTYSLGGIKLRVDAKIDGDTVDELTVTTADGDEVEAEDIYVRGGRSLYDYLCEESFDHIYQPERTRD